MKILLTIFFCCLLYLDAHSKELKIATANGDGGYFTLAKSIKNILLDSKLDVNISLIKTDGSVDNIKRLEDGSVNFAIVQNDVAFFAENGLNLFSNHKIDDLRYVISFYKEPVFFVTNRKDIYDLEQLMHKRVNIGKIGSGTRNSVLMILKEIGILDSIIPVTKGIKESLLMLKENKIEATVVNHLDQDILNAIKQGKMHVVPIKKRIVQALHNTYPFYTNFETKIFDESINTLSTTAIFVTRDDVSPLLVEQIVSKLYKDYNHLIFTVDSQNTKTPFSNNSLHFYHEGVKNFIDKNNIKIKEAVIDIYLLYIILSLFLVIVFLLTIVILVLNFSHIFHRYSSSHKLVEWIKKIYEFLVRYKYLFLLFIIIIIYITFVLLIKYFEHKWAIENEILSQFDNFSFYESLRWLFVFGSSGYSGNFFPNSEAGKIIASFVPLIGIGGIIALVGLVVYDKLKSFILEGKGMQAQKIKDHIILCGWNQNSHFIIKNLLHKNLTTKKQIVILADIDYNQIIKQYNFDPMMVFFVKGKATKREDLLKANLPQADIAIVISEDGTVESDANTILQVLTIEKYCLELEDEGKRKNRANIYTIAEIIDPQNEQIAIDASVDQIISLGNIEAKIFTQAVQNPGVARFLNEIMTYNDENDIYSFPIREDHKLFNKTYDEILTMLRKYNILLLSINIENKKNKKQIAQILKQNGLNKTIITNPFSDNEKNYRVQKDDLIIVLAQYEKNIIKMLKEI